VTRFLRDERGATAIEYGLIAALIFLAIISGVSIFGTKTTATYKIISDAVDAVL
jgi:pilus assembly protein Flp/PilA